MERRNVKEILTFDRDFDRWPVIRRVRVARSRGIRGTLGTGSA
jgi:hypothetical protein